MYQLTNNSSIIRIADNACIPADTANRDYAEYLNWLNGGNTPLPVPAPPQPDLQTSVVQAVQNRLDEFARTRGYDGILSACTYATSKVPKFAAEGAYCVDARDDHWAACYAILAAVEAETRSVPTLAEVIQELPPLAWPA